MLRQVLKILSEGIELSRVEIGAVSPRNYKFQLRALTELSRTPCASNHRLTTVFAIALDGGKDLRVQLDTIALGSPSSTVAGAAADLCFDLGQQRKFRPAIGRINLAIG